jgi:hypothetical protein
MNATRPEWKGGKIVVDENGEILRVEDLEGNKIDGKQRTARKVAKKTILMEFVDDDEERCIYDAAGNCYCR